MLTPSRRRAALSTLFGTGATVLITVAQAFLLIPLCLKYLGAGLYGAWLGASELLLWVQLLDLGIPNLMTQRIGASIGRADPREAARWSWTGLSVLAGSSLVLTAVAVFAAPLVSVWARVPAQDAAAFTASFRVGAVASALLLLYHGTLGIARGVQMTGLVNVAQVAGAVAGFAAAVWLLLEGFGIWALAMGLLARAAVSLAGGALFLVRARRSAGLQFAAPSMSVVREMRGLAPSMAAANAGYLLANYTDVVLVTTILGPVAAAVYALTRRAIDGVRSLLESIAWAAYGGFAHLVTATDRHRSRAVLREILWLRLAAACLCAAVVLGVNEPFVTLLFGAENFGGVWLTAGFAVQMVVSGQAFLSNYLLRAAGDVYGGSLLLAGEAGVRAAGVYVALTVVGLVAAPWVAAAVSAVALMIALEALDRRLPPAQTVPPRPRVPNTLAPYAVLGLGFIAAMLGTAASWISVSAVGAILTISGLWILWLMQPPETVARIGWRR